MLKKLKNCFLYKAPEETMGFEFTEEPEESALSERQKNIDKNGEKKNMADRSKNKSNTGKREEETEDKKTEDPGKENETENGSHEDNKNEAAEKHPEKKNGQDEEKDRNKASGNAPENEGEISEKPGEDKGYENKDICEQTLIGTATKILKPISVEELARNKREGRKAKQPDKQEEGKEKNEDICSAAGQEERANNESKQDEDVKGRNKEEADKDSEKERKKREDEEDKKSAIPAETRQIKVSRCYKDNLSYIKKTFHVPQNKDVVIREFNIAKRLPAFIVFIDGMVNNTTIMQFTLPQLMNARNFEAFDFESGCALDYIERNVLSVNQIIRMDNFKDINPQILSGLTAIFIDGCEECLVLETRGFEKRSISAPVTETVVNGSQEGFTENLRTNITLIRRIVKNENLVTEFFPVSKTNNSLAGLLYLKSVTNPELVEEVKRRVKSLNIDYISGNGMLEQLMEDKSNMLFPELITTERPDRTASFLMDGKVVLICEGTPFALAMPITFFDLFHTSEEANIRWPYGTFLRIIRLIGVIIAALLPGMYVALVSFHQEMIPTALLSSIVVSRISVPFPIILEILLMEISFELIREGGIRVPGVTGQTLGIIGALILGQAAVSAGLVSPIAIIVVAVTGLGNFAIPNYSLALAIRIARFMVLFMGAIAGFYGISVGVTIASALALGMKSFGVPFFSTVAPKTRSNPDVIIRGPLTKQKLRPDFLNTQNEKRMADNPKGWKVSSGKDR